MSQRLRTRGRALISRSMVILHSLLSWMHWPRRRREAKARLRAMEEVQRRQELRQWVELSLLPAQRRQQEELLRELLWEMALPLAQALHRMEQQQALMLEGLGRESLRQHLETQELLKEVLNSLQPSAEQQIFPSLMQIPQ